MSLIDLFSTGEHTSADSLPHCPRGVGRHVYSKALHPPSQVCDERRRAGKLSAVSLIQDGRHCADLIGYLPLWLLPVMAASFPLWLLPVMATSRYGYFPLWLLPVMAASFPLWLLPSRYGYFPLWLLPVMATSRYGYFPLWLLPVMATSFPLWLLPSRYGYFLPVMATSFPLWLLPSHYVYTLHSCYGYSTAAIK